MNTTHKIFDTKIAEFFFMATIIPIAAIGFFASDIYLPSLPAIGNYFHNSNLDVQLTMSIFLIAMAVSQVFIGTLSDKIGRKPVLLCFLFIFIVASFGCFHAQSLNELIFFRFVQGIGAASGMTIAQAIVSDLYGPVHSAKPLSIIIPLVAFSPAIAPILGGFIEEKSNWKNIFFFLAFYGIVIFILLLTPIIPKLNPQKTQAKTLENKENFFQILKNKHFIGFALCMMNSNACYFAFLAAAPFLLKQFGYTPTQVGYAFCASSFPYMFGSFFGRKLSKRHSYLQIILLGLMFDALGVVTMILLSAIHWQHMLAIMIPVFLISIGNGFIMPYSSASAIALSPKNAGFVTGTLGTLQLCAASFGTFMMGVLANGTLYPLALFNSCVVTFTLCYFLFVFRGQINKRIN